MDCQIFLEGHITKHEKITPQVEETILDLRLTKRFGCSRLGFRLKEPLEYH
ncbi:hypothetical protein BH23THE1_BH23THE1_31760 [soil metagenome]